MATDWTILTLVAIKPIFNVIWVITFGSFLIGCMAFSISRFNQNRPFLDLYPVGNHQSKAQSILWFWCKYLAFAHSWTYSLQYTEFNTLCKHRRSTRALAHVSHLPNVCIHLLYSFKIKLQVSHNSLIQMLISMGICCCLL